MQQKLAQGQGVGQVTIGGGALPGVRVEVNPTALNHLGLSMEDVRAVLTAANANRPKGELDGRERAWSLAATDQLLYAAQYQDLVLNYHNGAAVRLRDIAAVSDSVEDIRTTELAN